ncbi:MAG: 16S rRNA (uracil(1498)-N(3))-methyltransferase, partial [Rhodospirillaceae bacterium]|nr:16S rRNA (uracil(1498)-N(3))-methyltransferase [Rhodospirillaceae bacterium]
MTAPETEAPGSPAIRLYVEAPLAAGATVAPSAEQHHYLRNVMRTPAGAAVRLFNGRDGEWLATVEALGRRGAALAVTAQTRRQQPEPDLWLCFAPVKKARIDFVAQKASELGVSALQPVLTRHTQVARVNEARLRANAVEAAEQCARLTVPAVLPAVKLDALMAGWPADRQILLLDETQTG